jgi:hypothetical protein
VTEDIERTGPLLAATVAARQRLEQSFRNADGGANVTGALDELAATRAAITAHTETRRAAVKLRLLEMLGAKPFPPPQRRGGHFRLVDITEADR